MNKFIMEQLNECKVANISEFNNDSTIVYIDGIRKNSGLKFGKYYHMVLANYVVNPPPNFDLADNWNNGTKPSNNDIYAEIIQSSSIELNKAKMIKISGRCDPSGQMWTGWVPVSAIEKCEELK